MNLVTFLDAAKTNNTHSWYTFNYKSNNQKIPYQDKSIFIEATLVLDFSK